MLSKQLHFTEFLYAGEVELLRFPVFPGKFLLALPKARVGFGVRSRAKRTAVAVILLLRLTHDYFTLRAIITLSQIGIFVHIIANSQKVTYIG